jgi:hypothetical protein
VMRQIEFAQARRVRYRLQAIDFCVHDLRLVSQ